jgi:hypothetical protein
MSGTPGEAGTSAIGLARRRGVVDEFALLFSMWNLNRSFCKVSRYQAEAGMELRGPRGRSRGRILVGISRLVLMLVIVAAVAACGGSPEPAPPPSSITSGNLFKSGRWC